jgi:hypothetical protein
VTARKRHGKTEAQWASALQRWYLELYEQWRTAVRERDAALSELARRGRESEDAE